MAVRPPIHNPCGTAPNASLGGLSPLINPAPIYDGVNAVLLDRVAAQRGSTDPRWVPMALMESNGLFPKYKERPVCIAFRSR